VKSRETSVAKILKTYLNSFAIDEDDNFEIQIIENVSTSKTAVTKALGELNLNINNVIPHFIFATAGYHGIDFWFDREEISSVMELLKIKTVILTNISKHKRRIVTHKKMKSYYEDKEPTYKISLGDDLCDFIEKLKTIDIKSDFDADEEIVLSYFLPMLTEEEKILLKRKDESYLSTFQEKAPDTSETEMEESISTRKYSFWECWRSTQILKMKN